MGIENKISNQSTRNFYLQYQYKSIDIKEIGCQGMTYLL